MSSSREAGPISTCICRFYCYVCWHMVSTHVQGAERKSIELGVYPGLSESSLGANNIQIRQQSSLQLELTANDTEPPRYLSPTLP